MKEARIGEMIVQMGKLHELSEFPTSLQKKDRDIMTNISCWFDAIHSIFMHHPELHEYLETIRIIEIEHLLFDKQRAILQNRATCERSAKERRQLCKEMAGNLQCGNCEKKEGKKKVQNL